MASCNTIVQHLITGTCKGGEHQENAQSDRKRLEALPVLTVVSKRIEVHRIATQCLVSHRFALHVLHSDEADGARA